jgi:hypothetical protein
MLPPVQTHRRLQRAEISGLNPELGYLLPTLHEQRCRCPCKARFRLVGCTFAGRESNPLDRCERFQATSIPPSRTFPDASLIFLKLFDWVYAPLTAALLNPVHAHRTLPNHKRSPLDRLYQRLTDALDNLLRGFGLAFPPPINENKIPVGAPITA